MALPVETITAFICCQMGTLNGVAEGIGNTKVLWFFKEEITPLHLTSCFTPWESTTRLTTMDFIRTNTVIPTISWIIRTNLENNVFQQIVGNGIL